MILYLFDRLLFEYFIKVLAGNRLKCVLVVDGVGGGGICRNCLVVNGNLQPTGLGRTETYAYTSLVKRQATCIQA